MELEKFDGHNTIIAKDQTQYRPFPCWRKPRDLHGTTIACWKLTWRERFQILIGGRIWHKVLTFQQRLQPQLLMTERPAEIPFMGNV